MADNGYMGEKEGPDVTTHGVCPYHYQQALREMDCSDEPRKVKVSGFWKKKGKI